MSVGPAKGVGRHCAALVAPASEKLPAAHGAHAPPLAYESALHTETSPRVGARKASVAAAPRISTARGRRRGAGSKESRARLVIAATRRRGWRRWEA